MANLPPVGVGLRALTACLYRGGTSKGLVIPAWRPPAWAPLLGQSEGIIPSGVTWDEVLAAAMGAPDDEYRRQLDGIGGGTSSTSKAVIIAPPPRDGGTHEYDATYSFAQISVTTGAVEWGGNCGNLTAAAAAFVTDEHEYMGGNGVVKDGTRRVRLLNKNTGKTVLAHVPCAPDGRYAVRGDFANPGVPGTGAPIRLEFLQPSGALTSAGCLPAAGAPITELPGKVRASLVDVTTAVVLLSEADGKRIGMELDGGTPVGKEALVALEHVRRAGAEAMRLDPAIDSVPKVGVVGSGVRFGATLAARFLSMGQPPASLPLTCAMAVGAAARLPGTVAYEATGGRTLLDDISIAHPAGVLEVSATLEPAQAELASVGVTRTARRLFAGTVFY